MRNAVIGAALAILFIGGLFAAARFGGTHTLKATAPVGNSGGSPTRALPPAKAAARITTSFIGRQQIGDWILECRKPRKMPRPPGGLENQPAPAPNSSPRSAKSPQANGPANEAQTVSSDSNDKKLHHVPAGFMIPRCRTSAYLPVPGDPKETFRVNFRLFGFRRLLAVFMQVPQESDPGDAIKMEVSTKTIPVPVRGCNLERCLVAESFKVKDTPSIMTTKSLVFIFPPGADGKPRPVKTSAYGLPEVLATIRRIDK